MPHLESDHDHRTLRPPSGPLRAPVELAALGVQKDPADEAARLERIADELVAARTTIDELQGVAERFESACDDVGIAGDFGELRHLVDKLVVLDDDAVEAALEAARARYDARRLAYLASYEVDEALSREARELYGEPIPDDGEEIPV